MGLGSRLLGTVLVVGAGALAVAAVLAAPGALRAARPLVREGLKRGLDVYDRVRGAAAEFTDDVEDLVAEVRSDFSSEHVPNRTGQPRSSAASKG
ncbi:MAG: DUF5132 domain-containing protein [Hyphomonadaceae bacterium]